MLTNWWDDCLEWVAVHLPFASPGPLEWAAVNGPWVLRGSHDRGPIPNREPHTWSQRVSSLAAGRRLPVPFVIKAGKPKP